MDTEGIRLIVRRKLAGGDLPHEIGRFEGRPSQGEQCDVCKEVVGAEELVIIATDNQGLKFGLDCFCIWDQERDAPGGAMR